MTEAEWLACNYPMPMLEFLQGKVSDRKLRLFAFHCCIQPSVCRHLNDEARALVIDAFRIAEGSAAWDVRAAADNASGGFNRYRRNWMRQGGSLRRSGQAIRAAFGLAMEDAWEAAWEVVRMGTNLLGGESCDLLREIVGNPFRPVNPTPAWLAWNDGTVVKLAQVIHDESAFDRLPILADALEDAGCTDAAILSHCRGEGPHVRCCWAVDLVLGKD